MPPAAGGKQLSLVVKARADLTEFRRLSAEVRRFTSNIGKYLAVIGGGISGLLTTASVFGSKFSFELKKTTAILGDISGASFDLLQNFGELEEKARDLGRTTMFTATEAAGAMYDLASAGFNLQEIVDGIDDTLILAGATASNLVRSTEIVTAAIKQFGLSAKDANMIVDTFTSAIANSKLNMTRLTEGMKYAGATGASLGWTLQETVGALAQFADLGLEGSLAGTNLRMAMVALAKQTPRATTALNRLGIEFSEVNPRTHNFAQIVNRLAKAIDEIGNKSLTAKDAIDLFGARAGLNMLSIIYRVRSGLVDIQQFIDILNASDAADVARRMYESMIDTVYGKFKILLSALQELAITIYKLFEQDIKDAFDYLKIKLDEVTFWIKEHETELKALISNMREWVSGWAEIFEKLAKYTGNNILDENGINNIATWAGWITKVGIAATIAGKALSALISIGLQLLGILVIWKKFDVGQFAFVKLVKDSAKALAASTGLLAAWNVKLVRYLRGGIAFLAVAGKTILSLIAKIAFEAYAAIEAWNFGYWVGEKLREIFNLDPLLMPIVAGIKIWLTNVKMFGVEIKATFYDIIFNIIYLIKSLADAVNFSPLKEALAGRDPIEEFNRRLNENYAETLDILGNYPEQIAKERARLQKELEGWKSVGSTWLGELGAQLSGERPIFNADEAVKAVDTLGEFKDLLDGLSASQKTAVLEGIRFAAANTSAAESITNIDDAILDASTKLSEARDKFHETARSISDVEDQIKLLVHAARQKGVDVSVLLQMKHMDDVIHKIEELRAATGAGAVEEEAFWKQLLTLITQRFNLREKLGNEIVQVRNLTASYQDLVRTASLLKAASAEGGTFNYRQFIRTYEIFKEELDSISIVIDDMNQKMVEETETGIEKVERLRKEAIANLGKRPEGEGASFDTYRQFWDEAFRLTNQYYDALVAKEKSKINERRQSVIDRESSILGEIIKSRDGEYAFMIWDYNRKIDLYKKEAEKEPELAAEYNRLMLAERAKLGIDLEKYSRESGEALVKIHDNINNRILYVYRDQEQSVRKMYESMFLAGKDSIDQTIDYYAKLIQEDEKLLSQYKRGTSEWNKIWNNRSDVFNDLSKAYDKFFDKFSDSSNDVFESFGSGMETIIGNLKNDVQDVMGLTEDVEDWGDRFKKTFADTFKFEKQDLDAGDALQLLQQMLTANVDSSNLDKYQVSLERLAEWAQTQRQDLQKSNKAGIEDVRNYVSEIETVNNKIHDLESKRIKTSTKTNEYTEIVGQLRQLETKRGELQELLNIALGRSAEEPSGTLALVIRLIPELQERFVTKAKADIQRRLGIMRAEVRLQVEYKEEIETAKKDIATRLENVKNDINKMLFFDVTGGVFGDLENSSVANLKKITSILEKQISEWSKKLNDEKLKLDLSLELGEIDTAKYQEKLRELYEGGKLKIEAILSIASDTTEMSRSTSEISQVAANISRIIDYAGKEGSQKFGENIVEELNSSLAEIETYRKEASSIISKLGDEDILNDEQRQNALARIREIRTKISEIEARVGVRIDELQLGPEESQKLARQINSQDVNIVTSIKIPENLYAELERVQKFITDNPLEFNIFFKKDAIKDLDDKIRSFVERWNSHPGISIKITEDFYTGNPTAPTPPTPPQKFQIGGRIPGYGGGDRVRALLEPGEFVLRKEAVQKYGLKNIYRMNEMRFQTGGVVPGSFDQALQMQDELKKRRPFKKLTKEEEEYYCGDGPCDFRKMLYTPGGIDQAVQMHDELKERRPFKKYRSGGEIKDYTADSDWWEQIECGGACDFRQMAKYMQLAPGSVEQAIEIHDKLKTRRPFKHSHEEAVARYQDGGEVKVPELKESYPVDMRYQPIPPAGLYDTPYPRPPNWTENDEVNFQKWYKQIAFTWNLDPNADSALHYYNYRYAWASGIRDPGQDGHWPSEFKTAHHPNRFVVEKDHWIDTISGSIVDIPRYQMGGLVTGGGPTGTYDQVTKYFIDNFNTPITNNREQYLAELFESGRVNDIPVYDMQGFFNQYGSIILKEGQHYFDTYKKPLHPTFSNESIYHGSTTNFLGKDVTWSGGSWGVASDGHDLFYAGDTQQKFYSDKTLQEILNEEAFAEDRTPVELIWEYTQGQGIAPPESSGGGGGGGGGCFIEIQKYKEGGFVNWLHDYLFKGSYEDLDAAPLTGNGIEELNARVKAQGIDPEKAPGFVKSFWGQLVKTSAGMGAGALTWLSKFEDSPLIRDENGEPVLAEDRETVLHTVRALERVVEDKEKNFQSASEFYGVSPLELLAYQPLTATAELVGLSTPSLVTISAAGMAGGVPGVTAAAYLQEYTSSLYEAQDKGLRPYQAETAAKYYAPLSGALEAAVPAIRLAGAGLLPGVARLAKPLSLPVELLGESATEMSQTIAQYGATGLATGKGFIAGAKEAPPEEVLLSGAAGFTGAGVGHVATRVAAIPGIHREIDRAVKFSEAQKQVLKDRSEQIQQIKEAYLEKTGNELNIETLTYSELKEKLKEMGEAVGPAAGFFHPDAGVLATPHTVYDVDPRTGIKGITGAKYWETVRALSSTLAHELEHAEQYTYREEDFLDVERSEELSRNVEKDVYDRYTQNKAKISPYEYATSYLSKLFLENSEWRGVENDAIVMDVATAQIINLFEQANKRAQATQQEQEQEELLAASELARESLLLSTTGDVIAQLHGSPRAGWKNLNFDLSDTYNLAGPGFYTTFSIPTAEGYSRWLSGLYDKLKPEVRSILLRTSMKDVIESKNVPGKITFGEEYAYEIMTKMFEQIQEKKGVVYDSLFEDMKKYGVYDTFMEVTGQLGPMPRWKTSKSDFGTVKLVDPAAYTSAPKNASVDETINFEDNLAVYFAQVANTIADMQNGPDFEYTTGLDALYHNKKIQYLDWSLQSGRISLESQLELIEGFKKKNLQDKFIDRYIDSYEKNKVEYEKALAFYNEKMERYRALEQLKDYMKLMGKASGSYVTNWKRTVSTSQYDAKGKYIGLVEGPEITGFTLNQAREIMNIGEESTRIEKELSTFMKEREAGTAVGWEKETMLSRSLLDLEYRSRAKTLDIPILKDIFTMNTPGIYVGGINASNQFDFDRSYLPEEVQKLFDDALAWRRGLTEEWWNTNVVKDAWKNAREMEISELPIGSPVIRETNYDQSEIVRMLEENYTEEEGKKWKVDLPNAGWNVWQILSNKILNSQWLANRFLWESGYTGIAHAGGYRMGVDKGAHQVHIVFGEESYPDLFKSKFERQAFGEIDVLNTPNLGALAEFDIPKQRALIVGKSALAAYNLEGADLLEPLNVVVPEDIFQYATRARGNLTTADNIEYNRNRFVPKETTTVDGRTIQYLEDLNSRIRVFGPDIVSGDVTWADMAQESFAIGGESEDVMGTPGVYKLPEPKVLEYIAKQLDLPSVGGPQLREVFGNKSKEVQENLSKLDFVKTIETSRFSKLSDSEKGSTLQVTPIQEYVDKYYGGDMKTASEEISRLFGIAYEKKAVGGRSGWDPHTVSRKIRNNVALMAYLEDQPTAATIMGYNDMMGKAFIPMQIGYESKRPALKLAKEFVASGPPTAWIITQDLAQFVEKLGAQKVPPEIVKLMNKQGMLKGAYQGDNIVRMHYHKWGDIDKHILYSGVKSPEDLMSLAASGDIRTVLAENTDNLRVGDVLQNFPKLKGLVGAEETQAPVSKIITGAFDEYIKGRNSLLSVAVRHTPTGEIESSKGAIHPMLLERLARRLGMDVGNIYDIVDQGDNVPDFENGFLTPGGVFLNRESALKWVRVFEEKEAERLQLPKGNKKLEALDYQGRLSELVDSKEFVTSFRTKKQYIKWLENNFNIPENVDDDFMYLLYHNVYAQGEGEVIDLFKRRNIPYTWEDWSKDEKFNKLYGLTGNLLVEHGQKYTNKEPISLYRGMSPDEYGEMLRTGKTGFAEYTSWSIDDSIARTFAVDKGRIAGSGVVVQADFGPGNNIIPSDYEFLKNRHTAEYMPTWTRTEKEFLVRRNTEIDKIVGADFYGKSAEYPEAHVDPDKPRSKRFSMLDEDSRYSYLLNMEGKPEMFLHGTKNAGFTKFLMDFAKAEGLVGPGFYLTSAPHIAFGYAGSGHRELALNPDVKDALRKNLYSWYSGSYKSRYSTPPEFTEENFKLFKVFEDFYTQGKAVLQKNTDIGWSAINKELEEKGYKELFDIFMKAKESSATYDFDDFFTKDNLPASYKIQDVKEALDETIASVNYEETSPYFDKLPVEEGKTIYDIPIYEILNNESTRSMLPGWLIEYVENNGAEYFENNKDATFGKLQYMSLYSEALLEGFQKLNWRGFHRNFNIGKNFMKYDKSALNLYGKTALKVSKIVGDTLYNAQDSGELMSDMLEYEWLYNEEMSKNNPSHVRHPVERFVESVIDNSRYQDAGIDNYRLFNQSGAPGFYAIAPKASNQFDLERLYSQSETFDIFHKVNKYLAGKKDRQYAWREKVGPTNVSYDRGDHKTNRAKGWGIWRDIAEQIGSSQANEAFQSIGYTGFRHIGGFITGQDEKHQVNIMFEDERMPGIFSARREIESYGGLNVEKIMNFPGHEEDFSAVTGIPFDRAIMIGDAASMFYGTIDEAPEFIDYAIPELFYEEAKRRDMSDIYDFSSDEYEYLKDTILQKQFEVVTSGDVEYLVDRANQIRLFNAESDVLKEFGVRYIDVMKESFSFGGIDVIRGEPVIGSFGQRKVAGLRDTIDIATAFRVSGGKDIKEIFGKEQADKLSMKLQDVKEKQSKLDIVKVFDQNVGRQSYLLDMAGAPQMFIHGTKNAGFTTFLMEFAKSHGLVGPGFYLTASPEIAWGYAGQGKREWTAKPDVAKAIEGELYSWYAGAFDTAYGGRQQEFSEDEMKLIKVFENFYENSKNLLKSNEQEAWEAINAELKEKGLFELFTIAKQARQEEKEYKFRNALILSGEKPDVISDRVYELEHGLRQIMSTVTLDHGENKALDEYIKTKLSDEQTVYDIPVYDLLQNDEIKYEFPFWFTDYILDNNIDYFEKNKNITFGDIRKTVDYLSAIRGGMEDSDWKGFSGEIFEKDPETGDWKTKTEKLSNIVGDTLYMADKSGRALQDMWDYSLEYKGDIAEGNPTAKLHPVDRFLRKVLYSTRLQYLERQLFDEQLYDVSSPGFYAVAPKASNQFDLERYYSSVELEDLVEKMNVEAKKYSAVKDPIRIFGMLDGGWGDSSAQGWSIWREVSDSIGPVKANKVFKDLGYTGFRHIGGYITGQETKHQVNIMFEDERIPGVFTARREMEAYGELLPYDVDMAINTSEEGGDLFERTGVPNDRAVLIGDVASLFYDLDTRGAGYADYIIPEIFFKESKERRRPISELPDDNSLLRDSMYEKQFEIVQSGDVEYLVDKANQIRFFNAESDVLKEFGVKYIDVMKESFSFGGFDVDESGKDVIGSYGQIKVAGLRDAADIALALMVSGGKDIREIFGKEHVEQLQEKLQDVKEKQSKLDIVKVFDQNVGRASDLTVDIYEDRDALRKVITDRFTFPETEEARDILFKFVQSKTGEGGYDNPIFFGMLEDEELKQKYWGEDFMKWKEENLLESKDEGYHTYDFTKMGEIAKERYKKFIYEQGFKVKEPLTLWRNMGIEEFTKLKETGIVENNSSTGMSSFTMSSDYAKRFDPGPHSAIAKVELDPGTSVIPVDYYSVFSDKLEEYWTEFVNAYSLADITPDQRFIPEELEVMVPTGTKVKILDTYMPDEKSRASALTELDSRDFATTTKINDIDFGNLMSMIYSEKINEAARHALEGVQTGSISMGEVEHNVRNFNMVNAGQLKGHLPYDELFQSETMYMADRVERFFKELDRLKELNTLKFKEGGLVPGNTTGDKVSAKLESGEFVLNRNAVDKYGTDMLYKMNTGVFETGRETFDRHQYDIYYYGKEMEKRQENEIYEERKFGFETGGHFQHTVTGEVSLDGGTINKMTSDVTKGVGSVLNGLFNGARKACL